MGNHVPANETGPEDLVWFLHGASGRHSVRTGNFSLS